MTNIKQLRTFLGWCAFLNFIMILVIGWGFLLFDDRIFDLYNFFIPTPKEHFKFIWLCTVALWKIAAWVFFIIPYFVTVIIDKHIQANGTEHQTKLW